ncbi:MAG: ABC transporter ATP-binding protein [Elusimicrobiota bacterium]|jgi:ATP-binding cassette subfamily B protein/ATP-binding cassette subfamily C protein|nr:ABC transporter ATP-binding protein [Elusimicrobiota bacterium]
MKLKDLKQITKQLRLLLARKHKIYLAILVLFTVILSIVETVGVSIIMPFISAATNPSLIDTGFYKKFYDFFKFSSKANFVITFGFAIILFYCFRVIYNIAYIYVLQKVSMSAFKNWSRQLFKNYLKAPYKIFLQSNSSMCSQSIVSETEHVKNLVLNFLQMFSEIFTIFLLYCLLLMVNLHMTLVLTATMFSFTYFIITTITRISKQKGEQITKATNKIYTILAETFGNFKFIKLKKDKRFVTCDFDISIDSCANSKAIHDMLGQAPRFILESFGFLLLIVSVIFILWKFKDANKIIPILSIYALALYRILPALTRLLYNINALAFYQRSLDLVYKNISQIPESEGFDNIVFEKTIEVKNISFSYQNSKVKVLNNISLEIKKGEKVAIIGKSGSGKSTLVDILITINKPDSGNIFIDGAALTDTNMGSWRGKIGYIPQSIYLFDGKVADNVSFGAEHDEEKVISALKTANIWNFLLTKDGLNTFVGEGGIHLSGGQKQRIAIARALYGDPEILVLDEATSALDEHTESKIMEEIFSFSERKTLIVIAHRFATYQRCDRKIIIENGCIVD